MKDQAPDNQTDRNVWARPCPFCGGASRSSRPTDLNHAQHREVTMRCAACQREWQVAAEDPSSGPAVPLLDLLERSRR